MNSKGGINIDGIPLTCDWADIVDEDDNDSRQIFLSGLKEEANESIVREIFSQYGNVRNSYFFFYFLFFCLIFLEYFCLFLFN